MLVAVNCFLLTLVDSTVTPEPALYETMVEPAGVAAEDVVAGGPAGPVGPIGPPDAPVAPCGPC